MENKLALHLILSVPFLSVNMSDLKTTVFIYLSLCFFHGLVPTNSKTKALRANVWDVKSLFGTREDWEIWKKENLINTAG